MKDFKDLTLKDDFMFGIVMRHPKLCKMCLERILNKKIVKIEFPESQKTIDISVAAKSIRLDVYCEGEESVYNIEMQRSDFETQRGRYYQGMMDINLIEKGQHYSELKNNLVIFICTFDKFGEGRHLYTFENRCIQNPEIRYGDGTQKIVLNTKGTMNDIPTPLKNFLDYIDHGAVTDEYTGMLDAEVHSTLNNEKWRMDYMTYAMKIDDERYYARKEGRKEGLNEGSFLAKKSIIYRMIDRGKDAYEIYDDTGVSEKEYMTIYNMYKIDHNEPYPYKDIDMSRYLAEKNGVSETITNDEDFSSFDFGAELN